MKRFPQALPLLSPRLAFSSVSGPMRGFAGVALVALAALAADAVGATRNWGGSVDGDWSVAGNWSENAVPSDGDVVVVGSGSVVLTNTTAELGTFSITNATLTCSNWTTVLRATNVFVRDQGVLQHAACATNLAAGNTNRVHVVCTNLTVLAGGSIDADGLGYPGGDGVHKDGYGPGAGVGAGGRAGGGYGGRGGWAGGGAPYGSSDEPTDPGSGGGAYDAASYGGAGGGAVRLDVSGHAIVNGTITAKGARGGSSYGSSGSGGSVYLSCATLAGTNGSINVDGADLAGSNGGGGGGGRIAVIAATAPATPPHIAMSSMRGRSTLTVLAENGTVRISDEQLLPDLLSGYSGLFFGVDSLTRDSLTVSNGWMTLFHDPFPLTVTNALKVCGTSGRLDLSNATVTVGGDVLLDGGALYLYAATNRSELDCGNNLTLTNGGALHVWGGATNGTTVTNGGTVSVTGDVFVGDSCGIYPYSHTTNGGSVSFTMENLFVAASGRISADGTGFGGGDAAGNGATYAGYGPGRGGTDFHASAGHGGVGTNCAAGYGITYGSSNAPVLPGSGGAGLSLGIAGDGGGVVRMAIASTATVHGAISADGGSTAGYGGGGSGGSVFLSADTFAPASGPLSAKGGNGKLSHTYAGGGGGRIAILFRVNAWTPASTNVAAGGGGSTGTLGGTPGTTYYGFSGSFLDLQVDGDPVQADSPTPHGYGLTGVPSGSVSESVTTPAEEGDGGRYVCLGYTVTNAAGAFLTGSSSSATFDVTTNTTLTWLWGRQHYLVTAAATNGSLVQDQTGWYASTSQVTVAATADAGHHFLQWAGDVPAGQFTNNPLTVAMDQPRTVTAHFANDTATTREWNGTGNWFSPTNWSSPLGAGVPGAGDAAILRSGTCVLADTVAGLASLVVSNGATLSFTNWSTELNAGGAVVRSGAVVRHAVCGTNSAGLLTSNRVHIACTSLLIEANASIDVDECGYVGGGEGHLAGFGPGAGVGGNGRSGGGYGGRGGWLLGGGAYGSATAPTAPGSGGGAYQPVHYGGNGGGAVRLDVSGVATVNGTITANGGNGGSAYGSAGSGGGIYLSCGAFDGTSGVLVADGGRGGTSNGGGGGGGRIAVDSVAPPAGPPSVTFSARHGDGTAVLAIDGTVSLSDERFLPDVLAPPYAGCFLGFDSWTRNTLTVSNTWIGTLQDGMALTVSNDLRVLGSSGRFDLSNAMVTVGGDVLLRDGGDFRLYGADGCSLVCAGDVTLSNAAVFHVWGGITNGTTPSNGASVSVSGDLCVLDGSIVYPHSHPTNGGSVLFTVNNLFLAGNAQINANGLGFAGGVQLSGAAPGYGPGGGGANHVGAGGHGGQGASCTGGYGGTYGVSNAPVHAGSGGGGLASSAFGGDGGGVVWMEIAREATLHGTVSADGGPTKTPYSAGGAGGSIFLRAAKFAPAQGVLSAKGGNGTTSATYGGGGGGRIALNYRQLYELMPSLTNVNGGVGGLSGTDNGTVGTFFLIEDASGRGTMFMVR